MKIEPKKIILSQSDIEDAIKMWLLSKLDNEREEIGSLLMQAFQKNSGSLFGDCNICSTITILEKVRKG